MELVSLLCVSCGLIAAASASPAPRRQADRKFLQKQQELLQLFVNVQQPSYVQQQKQLGDSFDLDRQLHNFSRPFLIKQFKNTVQRGLLPRGEVFHYYNPNHLLQAIQLFDVFYFAKDYNTFYQAACWARERVNEGVFTYALSVTIAKRQDTQGVTLPPQSEVYPYLYVNTQAVQQAQNYKQQGNKTVNVRSNITGVQPQNLQARHQQNAGDQFPYSDANLNYQHVTEPNYEARLSYFTEDKALNQLFAYQQVHYPSWFHEEKYSYKWARSSGERFYYYVQQILARYNLERFANDLPTVQPFQFHNTVEPGYNPQLQYNNGQAVPARPNNVNFNNADPAILEQLLNLDRRFADAVDNQRVTDVNGEDVPLSPDTAAEVLGDLVQSNSRAVNRHFYAALGGLYGYLDLFRVVVASAYSQGQVPAAIENEGSALRDPIFYKVIARVVNFLQGYKSQLEPYKQQQLNFQGVEVQSVKVDQLETYFDNSQVDLYNAINYQQGEQAEQYKYNAYQQRLNYKPFNYNIQVQSDQNTDAIVRVFIGPQYDVQGNQYSLEQARQNFVEIDRFVANLKNGQNQIQRNSQQSTRFVQQQPNTRALYNQNQQGNYYNQSAQYQQQYTLPQNLLLPKGSQNGQQYVFAVAVHQYQPAQQGNNQQQPCDSRAQGFPFDRQVQNGHNFQQAKNIFFQTVTVYNKNQYNPNQ